MNVDLRALCVFEKALDVVDSRRSVYLDKACGEYHVLRKQVDELLHFLDRESMIFPGSVDERQSRVSTGDLLSDRYEIEESVGIGGMGEVYRARDRRLDRTVAIKILNAENHCNSEMSDRFEREIKSVASLNHPHIVTLYDVETHDNLNYAVMEFVAGKTLRELLSEALSLNSLQKVAAGVAEGLAAAHSQDLMHRDIKPENIIVTDPGQAKIIDFGLARSVTIPFNQEITTGNMNPGTIPYMSPEQATDGSLSCATNVFSLGTVIVEMLTGSNPFRGANAVETLHNISTKYASAAQSVRVVSTELRSLLCGMLSGDPASRPSVHSVAAELTELVKTDRQHDEREVAITQECSADFTESNSATTAPSSRIDGPPAIAILPLHTHSPDPNHRFIGDAISQEVILELSRLHSLFVIARGATFQFRNAETDIREASRLLGARYLLTGTFEAYGTKSLVAVELVHAPEQRVVWADRFECDMDELPQIRNAITGRLVVEIESRIQLSEAEHAVRLSTGNLDAWSACHRGLWHMIRFNGQDNQTAANLFQRAIMLDKRFARAHAGLSFTHFQDTLLDYSGDVARHRSMARKSAERSLDLDPHDPFANLTMGRSDWLENNLDGAASWLERSIELSPNYAFARYNRSLIDALLNNGQATEKNAT